MQPPINEIDLILKRRAIRRSFEEWCVYRMAKLGRTLALHHRLIVQTIEKLLRNELILLNGKVAKKLQIRTPPGSAKSTYTSKLLPAWFCNSEQHPFDLMLACSYSYTLIEGFGKEARNILEEEQNTLGINVSKRSFSSGDWRVNYKDREDGGYFCGGVGSGIAGHRALLGLIDDFLGTEKESGKESNHQSIYDWYRADFKPRLVPGAWEIIICNHRNEDDLVGRLEAEEGDEWYIISLPMEAEDNDILGRKRGERLWPEYFTDEMVRDAKKSSSTWAGLYQQRPSPEDGDYFKAENLLEYRPNDLPDNLRIYAGSDWAVREGDRNDYHFHCPAGLDQSGRLWILPDFYWEQADTLTSVNAMFDLFKRRGPTFWWHGQENITGAIKPFVDVMMKDRQTYIPIFELSESGRKEDKASSFIAMTQAKQVMFPGFHPRWSEMKSQLLAFPNGKHDDVVDGLAKLGKGISMMVKPSAPKKEWNGIVTPQKLTCGWLEKSSRRREKDSRFDRFRELVSSN